MVKRRQPKTREEFAARLRHTRETLYRSQKAFADACGLQPETYRMWERGDREPSLTNLKKIALALGASLDELVLGNRSRENPELNTGNKSALGVIASPDSWQWESDSSHRVTKAVMKTNIVGKRRRDYGINPSIPWRVVDVIMDNHQPIVDLKFQYILNGRLIAVSVSGEPVYGSRNEFVGYRGTGHEIKGMELDAYLRGIPKKN